MIVAERLSRHGHDVERAQDGAAAVKIFEAGNFNLAILDIRMPGLDGHEVCDRIKKSSKKIPVLLISAFSEEQTQWWKSNADRFLAKPFDGTKLLSVVEELLKLGDPK